LRIIFSLPVFLLLAFLMNGCRKAEKYLPTDVEILSPPEYASFNLPASIRVQVSVKSHYPINYIRISVNNADLIPMFGQKVFYPSTADTTIDYQMAADYLPAGEDGPFTIHIVVDDGKNLTSVFRSIRFVNAPLRFKGFYLITRSGINETRIAYYDSTFVVHPFANLNGNFAGACFSGTNDLLFVATSLPSRLSAFQFDGADLKWENSPEQPYPEYNDLVCNNNSLYAAMANERIAILSQSGGNQKLSTPIMPDTVPGKVTVSDDYFIADFRLRTPGQRVWMTFYKTTGNVYKRFSTDIKVIDFYPFTDGSGFYVFGNRGGQGLFGFYYPGGNFISGETDLQPEALSKTARINEHLFLFISGKTLFRFDALNKIPVMLKEFDEEIVDMAFDDIENNIFVAMENRVDVLSYPGLQLKKAILVTAPVKAIRLRYYY